MAKRKGKTTREEKSAVEQQETLPATGAAPAGTDALGEARREEPGPAGGAGQSDPAPHGQTGDTPAKQGADGAGEGDLTDGGSIEVEKNETSGGGGAADTGSRQPADAAGSEGDDTVSDDHEADAAGAGDVGPSDDGGLDEGDAGGNPAGGEAAPAGLVDEQGTVSSNDQAPDAGAENGDGDHADLTEPPKAHVSDGDTSIDAGDGSAGISDAPETPLSEIVPFAPEGEPGVVSVENPTDPKAANEERKDWDNPFSGYSSSAPVADGYTDGSIYTASCAAYAVLDHIGELHELPDGVPQRCDLLALGDDPEPANALAKYIRTIGRDRATPAVLGQQLKILGLVDNGELHPVEALIAKTFATTLCDLDDFDRQVAAWIEAAGKTAPQPVPVPIEDTTLEPVDDAFEATI